MKLMPFDKLPALNEILDHNKRCEERGRVLVLSLPKLRKVLKRCGIDKKVDCFDVILFELCLAANVEPPRDMKRAVKRNAKIGQAQEVRDFVDKQTISRPEPCKLGDKVQVRDVNFKDWDGEGEIVNKTGEHYFKVKMTSGKWSGTEGSFPSQYLKKL